MESLHSAWSMSMSWTQVVWILFLFPQLAIPFNFDLKHPIVIHDSYDKPDSHFGASVTLIAPSSGTGWVVIGAPKANSPFANYSAIKEPGVVWKCSLEANQGARNCSLLEVDPLGEMDVKIGQVPKEVIHRDRKDFGMFGASMAVSRGNSSRFVVCSSRWTNQKYKEHHLMNGLCYWLPTVHLFSHNPNIPAPDFSHRLLPLVNASRQAYTLAMANGQSAERRFDWAFGQAGFSVDISAKNEVLLGAPGILEWAGSVIQYRDFDPIKLSPPWRRYNQKDSVFAQVLVPRAQTNINRKVINYFDYFGYAVTSGHFFKSENGKTQYAAGAPRGSHLNGRVLIFSFQDDPGRDVGTPPEDALTFLVDPVTGEGANFFGSYFGSVLAATDVNGDGFDDLVIGAPLYETTATAFPESFNSSSSSENGDSPMNAGDEGCIFVYLSLGEDFSRNPQELCGESRPGARFGSAIARLGDINHDGFEDIAVGAPYEGDNQGAVYIYVGTSKRLVFSQKLSPDPLDLIIRGFGYSVSGEVDIDENGYSDLAVGAFDSNHVIIYTSRAVVDISGNLSSSVVALGTSTGVFSLTTCSSYKGHRAPDSLEIWVKLFLDPEIRKIRIVEFLPDDRILPENFSRNVIVFKEVYNPSGSCQIFNVSTIGDLDLVTIPVMLRQEIWLEELDSEEPEVAPILYELGKTGDGQASLQRIPNTDISSRSRFPIESPSSKGQSPAVISIPILAICEEDGDPNCLANLSLKATFKTSDGAPLRNGDSFVIGSSKLMILHVELMNHRERANLPLTVEIWWSNPLSLRSSKSDCKRVEVEEDSKQYKHYICSFLTPLSKNKKELLELELDMTGLYAGTELEALTFQLRANTSSVLVQEAIHSAQLPLSQKSQLVLLGQSSEASYYENITAETVNFTQLYEMGVTGLSPIYSLHFQAALPSGILVRGHRLPLLRIREPIITYDGKEMTCHAINGTFYKEVDARPDVDLALATGRAKRSPTAEKAVTLIQQQPIVINCQTPGVDCLWVECDVLEFDPSYRALVEFRLRMITETARRLFAEKDRDVMVIESMSRFSRVGRLKEVRFALARTVIRAEVAGELKAWILIVAIGGGIAIFAMITMLLMHCGFFRRSKLEELTKLKAGQTSVFTFDDTLEMTDSLQYYDGALTQSDFEYRIPGSQFSNTFPVYTDAIYDDLE